MQKCVFAKGPKCACFQNSAPPSEPLSQSQSSLLTADIQNVIQSHSRKVIKQKKWLTILTCVFSTHLAKICKFEVMLFSHILQDKEERQKGEPEKKRRKHSSSSSRHKKTKRRRTRSPGDSRSRSRSRSSRRSGRPSRSPKSRSKHGHEGRRDSQVGLIKC